MRRAAGVLGELLVTLGVIVLLFIVWQIGYVGVIESHRQAGVVEGLERQFTAAPATPPGSSPRPTTTPAAETGLADLASGEAFSVLRIPRLGGPSWSKPVLQGTSLDVLAQGLGHYASTALPGQVGNLAIAGHRSGHGNPLIDIDAVRPGDALVLETRAGWYVYRAVRHEIVAPDASEVLAPVPGRPGVTPKQRWFTLTSCNPRYGSSARYIVYSLFEKLYPRAGGLPATVLAEPGES